MAVLIMSLPIIFAEEYSRQYDANGNLIYDQQDDVYREYNELNQLVRTRQNNVTGIILQEYTFDPIKERIFIKDEFYTNGSLKSSTYYFDDDYIVIQNSSGTYNRTNIYQDGILVGYEDFDGRKRYVLPDHEGSANIILNESGDVIEENLFSPFAEPLQGVIENKFSYEAKEYDPLTKDYDFHFRKFSVNGPPILNQPDTVIPNRYDPQSLNRYAFERNSPYKYKEESGHFPVLIAAAALIGGVVNTINYYAIHDNPTLGGAATYFATGAIQGALISSGAVLLVGSAVLGEVAERAVDDESLTDNLFDYVAEGTFAVGATKLVGGLFPKPIGSKNIKHFSSVFTSKSGQQFITNQVAENVGISAGQSAYYNNPNIKNVADNSNKASESSGSSGGGGRGSSRRSKSAGTSTLGSNSIYQIIQAAGGSTLRTAEQRAASESIAASIISRQRAKASSS